MARRSVIEAAVEKVTPSFARELLGRNEANRPLNQAVVKSYAAMMARGEWELNGEAIKVDVDGNLVDGQHRLEAVSHFGKPIRMLVLRGLDPRTFATIDTGRRRSFADVLYIRGEQYPHILAAAVRMVWVYEHFGRPFARARGGARPAYQLLAATLERHPNVRESVLVNGDTDGILALSRSQIAALHYLFTWVDATDADVFFRRLATGENLVQGDAVYALRESFIKELRNDRWLRKQYVIACTVKAFNLWRAGEQVERIRWQGGGANPEPFPTIENCSLPLRESS